MSKLYWKKQIISSDLGSDLVFVPGTNTQLEATRVTEAINEVATKKTGIIMSQNVTPQVSSGVYGDVTVTFTHTKFSDYMYVDPYTSINITYDDVIYDSTHKTLTYTFKALEHSFTMKIVVQF